MENPLKMGDIHAHVSSTLYMYLQNQSSHRQSDSISAIENIKHKNMLLFNAI